MPALVSALQPSAVASLGHHKKLAVELRYYHVVPSHVCSRGPRQPKVEAAYQIADRHVHLHVCKAGKAVSVTVTVCGQARG